MKPAEQRIAIAEACGYEPNCFDRDGSVFDSECNEVPDYLNDLNAMHEAEKMLTYAQCMDYTAQLNTLMGLDLEERCDSGASYPAAMDYWFHATASQRAEAFLKVIGKYKSQ